LLQPNRVLGCEFGCVTPVQFHRCIETFVKRLLMAFVGILRVERDIVGKQGFKGAVAELVGIEVGVVSGVFNLESSGVEASDWRPRHDEQYHEA
jgi:hypothetical protein